MPKVLYHGSSKKLVGDKLNPSQGDDSDERPENKLLGVYATDRKDFAITMAIITCPGVTGGSIEGFTKTTINAKIYGNLPKQKYIYLHTLSAKTFRPTKSIKHQFISDVPVKPIKTEKILVSDYLHLVKKATKEETKKWIAKYGIKK
ncbi:hypothetical protein KY314_04420 [Candidatus Woesearchaeota archaeon]|nr:hypothetical protein [Candidatus Woesearchaeota archaeon]